ncbi:MAG: RluA family pseudouridine synthase [Spirochaetaceae bacterium]|jgi:23S rRNA pseudouridine955/2504/2580 synthase|nr:RluA family pseudouridine synthase [Spirochaetaceae bacterium]
MKGLETLYEDDECIVINKPAGLPVQGGRGVSVSLDVILADLWKPRPLLVHRLDKETSGVILTAKTPSAAAYFSRIIAGKNAVKKYIALCHCAEGAPEQISGVITNGLTQKGVLKDAVTYYKRFAEKDGFALFQIELGTGRTHQIRRHLSQSGLPVIGDDKYGDFSLNKRFRKECGVKQMLLHASSLSFPPQNGKTIEISAPIPAYFNKALEILGIAQINNLI